MQWTKSNIPSYSSERVTVDRIYDPSRILKRHLRHEQVIKIDDEIVCSKSYYEDDDFASCSEEPPNSKDQWEEWVKTLSSE